MAWKLVAIALILVSCASGTSKAPTTTTITGDGLYPNVVDVVIDVRSSGAFDFDVTLSSPYDTPDRYADAWRVRSIDGVVYGVRELAHDHANEQPFTRSLNSVDIPVGVDEVVVEGRDQLNGWGGVTITAQLPGR